MKINSEIKETITKLIKDDASLYQQLGDEHIINLLTVVSSTVLMDYIPKLYSEIMDTLIYIGNSYNETVSNENLDTNEVFEDACKLEGLLEIVDHLHTLLTVRFKDVCDASGVDPSEFIDLKFKLDI